MHRQNRLTCMPAHTIHRDCVNCVNGVCKRQTTVQLQDPWQVRNANGTSSSSESSSESSESSDGSSCSERSSSESSSSSSSSSDSSRPVQQRWRQHQLPQSAPAGQLRSLLPPRIGGWSRRGKPSKSVSSLGWEAVIYACVSNGWQSATHTLGCALLGIWE
jgi:hypothetical protein